MVDRSEVVRFLVDTYYDGDPGRAASAAGFAKQLVTSWLDGKSTPRDDSIGRLIHGAFSPEFRVLFEYQSIAEQGSSLRGRLKRLFGANKHASGIYAFYDSMANLIYLGKSDGNICEECYQRLQAEIKEQVFPRGARQPRKRRDLVNYVSAYSVRSPGFRDDAKHIESLILRISKPVLNKKIGSLEKIAHA